MRMMLLALLVACGGGGEESDPQAITSCTPNKWGTYTMCARGCAAGTLGGVDANMDGQDDTCHVQSPAIGNLQCPVGNVATFEGERGCCVGEDTMKFYPCE